MIALSGTFVVVGALQARGDTINASSVNIPGDLQSELGCAGDWDPACPNTNLTYDAADDVWQGIFPVPAGNWQYKAALDASWAENYGLHAVPGGDNIPLSLAAQTSVKFYYDDKSHWITDNQYSVIAVAPGSFQSELGCPGDWDPGCLRSWLQDIDGDGIYTLSTTALPAGPYEFKVAIDESWAENYGQGGAPGGSNIPFNVPAGSFLVAFTYDSITHIPAVSVTPIGTASVTIAGDLQSELGCGGDWDPACAATHLTYDASDDVWQGNFPVPAGSWQYKAAINDSWDENYGLHALPGGDNIPINLGALTSVKFYYDQKSHWITDNQYSVIAVAPGSFQSELGCPGDWDPGCLRSWLQDIDGDGIYMFTTDAIPPGSYEFKVAINESWAENYGLGGVQNGSNILFSFTQPVTLTFVYNSYTHVPEVWGASPAHDNSVWWDGVRHDSREPLYRTPGGAVEAGTPVILRLRTYHNDITDVKLRVYDLNQAAQTILTMNLVAEDVDCYQADLPFTCDFWAITLPNQFANNFWYRFIISDGTDTDYYADNTPALDGGLGAMSEDAVDNSYALMVYDPDFMVPDWAHNAVIYQIFPDRFRNGRKDNDPKTGQLRYDDPVLKLPWGTLPEGYCRNYSDAGTNCPWRFLFNPPPGPESPRGRDYMGGDLKGIDQSLQYLMSLGVNTLYFNPVFDAASNHGYDTQDYFQIDPYFGTQKDWENLVKHANQLGMRIILDGVFNHLSSDSPFFDRYHRYPIVGACESLDSPYRDWFTFHEVAQGTGTCVGTGGTDSATYDGWFGFDSIPVLNKSNPEVQLYFITGPTNVTSYWLNKGAGGWRMDVMGDASFPPGYWQTFRDVVKDAKADALIIGELWQKDCTLLSYLRGERADTTMNYRLRDAILGLLTPGPFDSKGFADSGRILLPSEFASRLESIQEDYPQQVFYALMNLVDSHDTERILWALTPGSETTADKELNAANLAEGKQKVMIASLIQFTLPGAPTVYYGDELAMTGDDDPDDRRTYPMVPLASTNITNPMFSHYQALANLRKLNPVLINGDLRVLLADDASGVVAYGRKTGDRAAVIIINRSNLEQTGAVPVAGYIPDGVVFNPAYIVGTAEPGAISVINGELVGSLGPLSAIVLMTGTVDLTPPAAPTGLSAVEDPGAVLLSWYDVPGATGYNLYRSPLTGGGYIKVNTDPLADTSFFDSGLRNAQDYFYVVTALDGSGNESAYSTEVFAMPHLIIGWAGLVWPPTMNHVISAVNRTDAAFGQVWIDGVTQLPGLTPTLRGQLGFGPVGSNPAANLDWTWVEAAWNLDNGNNDELMASMLPESTGLYDYVYRYSTTNGRDWLYADLNGPISAGSLPPNPGKLTVNPSGDTTPPAIPTGLSVVSASPEGVSLAWDAVLGDPTLYGYEVLRSDTAGGLYTLLARLTGTSFFDLNVVEAATYYYVVRSVDLSFNRSAYSAELSATAELRTVTLIFDVTVPATTDGTGRSVYIAGTLDRLDGGWPSWNPGATVLTRVDATHWTITLTGKESTQIEYKYTLGDWEHVEKDVSCGELGNRMLTLSYGSNGTQTINDTVLNWRNIAPCGN
ncbi:MAG: alpha-amylase [Anaerolineae bacterium]|nr:alpha-amylase [Anaerolineae bacterium]